MMPVGNLGFDEGAPPPPLIGQRSRHRIAPFHLHRPSTIAEATAMFEAAGHAAFMAGGIDLVERLKRGLRVSDVVHLGRVAELRTIRADGDGLVIASGVTHEEVATSDAVRQSSPALAEAWSRVANVRVRLKGTVGGNLLAADPSYDAAMIALTLEAEFGVAGAEGMTAWERDVHAISSARLLTAIRFPDLASRTLSVERGWKPVIAFALSLVRSGPNISKVRIAGGAGFERACVHETVFDLPMPIADVASHVGDLARSLVSGLPEPLDDWNATRSYRRRLLGVLAARHLAAASEAPASESSAP